MTLNPRLVGCTVVFALVVGSDAALAQHHDDHHEGTLRLLVKPENTRVYVDGNYVGVADDFDGLFQRLHVMIGRHELTLALEGYREASFDVVAIPGHLVKVRHRMVPGHDPEAFDYRRAPAPPPRPRRSSDRDLDRDTSDAAGFLRLNVTPPDASVYVDGRLRGLPADVTRLPLAPGVHVVEVVRPGYDSVEREVQVRPGGQTPLDIALIPTSGRRP